MTSVFTGYLLIALLLAIAVFVFVKLFVDGQRGDISGKLIWTDHGKNTKSFSNHQFRVFGKPDLMYKVQRGVKAVEYKHRNGPIFDADIAQSLAASLAARGEGYQVIEVLIKTQTNEVLIDLRCSDKAIYSKIEKHIQIVRDAKAGKSMTKKPGARKCRSCAYRGSCA
tara:strand:- start:5230 stop:5733 length:504 start_codon:yes stop_codon:yes gene_type:complete